ncbi:MAG: glutamate--tRNA ligase [Candidatus Kryptonium sp.]|nr:glutamate--tRNA ligase [Candidatus Kryptonium sp.]MDW8109351.1 glutamate--tRNA ligase [Candidatus Kryptonium sp.]
MKTKTRFAPSPTGHLHIGGARTAIFNWLYSRKNNGEFYLRIEDTDKERSSEEMVQSIIDGLNWLGINWDGDIYFQSQHINDHISACYELVKKGHAYFCYCTEEELEMKRKQAEENKIPYKYDRKCLYLSQEEKNKFEKEGRSRTIRFKVPDGETVFFDVVHGEIRFKNSEIDDFIILRSDNTPVYNMAVVVDDHKMGITHVIRGDDHISNTPKQILIYQALGWDIPVFAHVPLILGPDRKRLSKRHGATAVIEYRERGFLPEAMFNYLCLLGWSPGDNREIMTIEEIIEAFDITKIQKKSAIFDQAKLEWMNSEYIRRKENTEILKLLKPIVKKYGYEVENDLYLLKVISLMKDRVKVLDDFVTFGKYFFEDPDDYDPEGVKKYWSENTAELLTEFTEIIRKIDDFNASEIERELRSFALEKGIKASDLIHPIRLAITGMRISPGLFELMETLGKETSIKRINVAVNKIPSHFDIKESKN